MSDTQCTTPAPESATYTKQRSREVKHLFWVDTMRVAEELQVDMRSLCGVWKSPGELVERDEDRDLLEHVGFMALPEPDDCKRCIRVFEAHNRRKWEQRQRRG